MMEGVENTPILLNTELITEMIIRIDRGTEVYDECTFTDILEVEVGRV